MQAEYSASLLQSSEIIQYADLMLKNILLLTLNINVENYFFLGFFLKEESSKDISYLFEIEV